MIRHDISPEQFYTEHKGAVVVVTVNFPIPGNSPLFEYENMSTEARDDLIECIIEQQKKLNDKGVNRSIVLVLGTDNKEELVERFESVDDSNLIVYIVDPNKLLEFGFYNKSTEGFLDPRVQKYTNNIMI